MSEYSQYEALYNRLVKMFRPRVERALREGVKLFTNEYEQSQHVEPKIIPSSLVYKSLKQLHITAALNGAKLTAKEIRKATKDNTERDNTWIWVVNEYLKLYGLQNLSIEITQTLRENIMRTIQKGIDKGWGVDKIVRELNNATFPKWMATRIVRTEINKAANTGAMVAATDSGILLDKKWISAQDDRTRRIPRDKFDHLDMNQKQVGMDERFVVPSTSVVEALLYPGDPEASAGNVINCRCRVAFVPVRDKEGRPVRVEKPSVAQPGAAQQQQQRNPFYDLLQQAVTQGITTFLVNQLMKEDEQGN